MRKHVRGGEGPGDKKERKKRKEKKTKTSVRRQEIGHRLCDGERERCTMMALSANNPKKKINPAA